MGEAFGGFWRLVRSPGPPKTGAGRGAGAEGGGGKGAEKTAGREAAEKGEGGMVVPEGGKAAVGVEKKEGEREREGRGEGGD